MIRIIVGILFVFSGMMKYYYFGDFYLFVEKYFSFLPFKSFFVNFINIFEVISGGFLLTKQWIKTSTLFVLSSSIFFLFISAYLYFYTDSQTCLCFGNNFLSNLNVAIPKNIILIIFTLILYNQNKSSENSPKYSFNLIVIVLLATTFFSQIFVDENSNYYGKQNIEGISVFVAKQLSEQDRIIFIDSRTISKNDPTITGALKIPYQFKYDRTIESLKKYIKENKIIITYCDHHMCTLAKNHAFHLRQHLFYDQIYYLKGGIRAWREQNF